MDTAKVTSVVITTCAPIFEKQVFTKDLQTIPFDMLVIGSGAAGLRAAIETKRLGARVLMTSNTRYLGGTDLGSSITRAIVHHHGGD